MLKTRVKQGIASQVIYISWFKIGIQSIFDSRRSGSMCGEDLEALS
jgi:hypothetical protein